MRVERVNVLGVQVHRVASEDLLEVIDDAIRCGKKKLLVYVNVHAINLAAKIPWFKDFLNGADITYPDGEGIRLGAWILGHSLPPQTALTRWIWDLGKFCADRGFRMYVLGGEQHVVEKAVTVLRERHPRLNIVGYHHGYFQKHGPETDAMVETINALEPNILLIGFGMPIQEDWIRRNYERLRVNAILTAGSSFDYAAGTKPVCPVWVSRIGLEWFYRFLFEPRRLFKRYFFGNPMYLARVLLQRVKNGKAYKDE